MKDGRRIKNNRLSIIGAEGIFKGTRFVPIADSNSPDRVSYEIVPCIGLQKNEDEMNIFR